MDEGKLFSGIDGFTDFSFYGTDKDSVIENLERLKRHKLVPRYFSAPIFLLWEITSRCPLDCMHCYNESPRKTDELSGSRAMAIAREIVELKIFSVCLSGGEPCMREDFLKIAKFLRAHRIPVSTVTNGWFITEKTAGEYARCFNNVQVSIDGGTAEVHDKIRARKGSFKRAVNAVKWLKKQGVYEVSIACTLNKYNVAGFYELVELCLEIGADKLRVQPVVLVGNAGKNSDMEAPENELAEIKKYIEKFNSSAERREQLGLEWGEPLPHISMGVRFGFSTHMRITAEGFFSFSPYLPFIMGSAKEMDLQVSWGKGLRTAWEIPMIRDNVKNIKNNRDLQEVSKKFDFRHVDLLKIEENR